MFAVVLLFTSQLCGAAEFISGDMRQAVPTGNGRAPKADFEAELQEMLTELVRDAKAVSPEVRADLVMQVG